MGFWTTTTALLSLLAIAAAGWAQPGDAARPSAVAGGREFATPREYLQHFGLDEPRWQLFVGAEPWSTPQEELLLQVLYRLPQFSPEEVQRWQQPVPDWSQLSTAPAEHQARLYRLRGRAVGVERCTLDANQQAALEFSAYYRVTWSTDDPSCSVVVLTPDLPPGWRERQSWDEPAAAAGLFLGVEPRSGKPPTLVFAAARLAWYPDQAHPEQGIGPDQLLLAEGGVDIGRLFELGSRNGRMLGTADREVFYEMLAAVRALPPDELAAAAQPTLSLPPLLQHPQERHGQLTWIRGDVLQITRVLVTEPDIRARYGIDHYFQLDVFVPLDDQRIQLPGVEPGQSGPLFTNTFPVTLCVLRLPPALERHVAAAKQPGVPSGPLREPIRMPAFFFRIWSYATPFAAAIDRRQRQFSPMFLGLEPELDTPGPTMPAWVGPLGAIACLAVFAGGWLLVSWYRRQDRQFAEYRRRRVGTGWAGRLAEPRSEEGQQSADGPPRHPT